MAKLDPITGPVPRAEFAEAVAAPAGGAAKIIRQYDPFFQRAEGEKIRWRIEAKSQMTGVAYVEAATQKEAEKLADDLDDAEFDWTSRWGIDEIVSIEPDKQRAR